VVVFDLWEENAYTDVARVFARLLEPHIFRSAAKVVVHNTRMAEHYHVKHGISCAVLPTSAEPWELAPPREPQQGDDQEILFAGAIYWAQEDALRRLSHVTRGLEGVRLTIVGSRTEDAALRDRGIF